MVSELEIVEMKLADECCGLGEPWGLTTHYDLSRKLRTDKIKSIVSTRADAVISWCFGCLIQMRDGLQHENSSIITKHPLVHHFIIPYRINKRRTP